MQHLFKTIETTTSNISITKILFLFFVHSFLLFLWNFFPHLLCFSVFIKHKFTAQSQLIELLLFIYVCFGGDEREIERNKGCFCIKFKIYIYVHPLMIELKQIPENAAHKINKYEKYYTKMSSRDATIKWILHLSCLQCILVCCEWD